MSPKRFGGRGGGAAQDLAVFLFVEGGHGHTTAPSLLKVIQCYSVDAVLEDIHVVANFFEKVAILTSEGALYEPIAYKFYCGVFLRFYVFVAPMLNLMRNQTASPRHFYGPVSAPEILRELDWLYNRWRRLYHADFPTALGIAMDTWK